MAKSGVLNFTQNIVRGSAVIVAADTTTGKELLAAGTEGTIVRSINAVSDDTAAVNLRLFVNDGSTDLQIGTINVPIASGTNGTAPSVDLLSAASIPSLPIDANGKRILLLAAGRTLKVAALATVTSGKTVTVTASGESY